MKNEGFTPQIMGELTPKNEGFTWVPMVSGFPSSEVGTPSSTPQSIYQ